MTYKVEYTKESMADLERLDFSVARRITKKIHFWEQQENPLKFAKPLKGLHGNRYRFRVGDYRIIFNITAAGTIVILLILTIRHRREVYRV